ncbi:MAG: GNAT family N-acetyltransferase [Crocinitomicaceae bacterium]|jgi:ribosomal protein S18 acetylase RimI-like enzyme
MEIRSPKTTSEWEEYYDLRYRILREPWKQPRGSERNEGDATGMHFGLYDSNQLLGILRLDSMEIGISQIRFMAVETSNQGKGIGENLMLFAEEISKNRGDKKIILHAREIALGFYEKLGYQLIEKSHLLFGEIQHYLMEKNI